VPEDPLSNAGDDLRIRLQTLQKSWFDHTLSPPRCCPSPLRCTSGCFSYCLPEHISCCSRCRTRFGLECWPKVRLRPKAACAHLVKCQIPAPVSWADCVFSPIWPSVHQDLICRLVGMAFGVSRFL